MDIKDWKNIQRQKPLANYAHFDYRVSLDQCWNYISDPEKVAHHGFYPFIHYTIKSRKVKKGKSSGIKKRDIYYSAHLDGWIYKYYAYQLNEIYNLRVEQDNLGEAAVAYRIDLKKSNIHFARDAFKFIKRLGSCYVMIGDFTNFFDTLDHVYLKQRICDLLNVKFLPQDYYAVFKNVTRFSYFDLDDLLHLNSIENNRIGRKELNKKSKVLSNEEFHKYKDILHQNPGHTAGVPQGSPISAVFANIYMLLADKQLHDYVAEHNGFYMRYSDDFMIVLPDQGNSMFSIQYEYIKHIIGSIPNLNLQESKTKLFHVVDQTVTNCSQEYMDNIINGKNEIDFLGFTYNGKTVTIRDKTLSKYYHRMYRKMKTIVANKGISKYGNVISCKNLYNRYSYKGTVRYQKRKAKENGEQADNNQIKGNFIDYVNRSHEIFKTESIYHGTKRHMQKIRKYLKKIPERHN